MSWVFYIYHVVGRRSDVSLGYLELSDGLVVRSSRRIRVRSSTWLHVNPHNPWHCWIFFKAASYYSHSQGYDALYAICSMIGVVCMIRILPIVCLRQCNAGRMYQFMCFIMNLLSFYFSPRKDIATYFNEKYSIFQEQYYTRSSSIRFSFYSCPSEVSNPKSNLIETDDLKDASFFSHSHK